MRMNKHCLPLLKNTQIFLQICWGFLFSSKHVLTEDAVVRKVTENNELHSVRILSKTNKVREFRQDIGPR